MSDEIVKDTTRLEALCNIQQKGKILETRANINN